MPASNDPERLRLWVRATTGLRPKKGAGDELENLSIPEWHQQRGELERVWHEALPTLDTRAGFERWYEDRAADASRVRDIADRRLHLDRLAELRPGDWLVRAGRVDLEIEAGRLARAERALAELQALAPAESLVFWTWSRAVEHLVAHRVEAALWYLDRVVAARPDDWRPLAHRAEAYRLLAREADADADEQRTLALRPDPHYLLDLIARPIRRQQFDVAASLAHRPEVRSALPLAERVLLDMLNGAQRIDPVDAAELLRSDQTLTNFFNALEIITLAPVDPALAAKHIQQLTPLMARLRGDTHLPAQLRTAYIHQVHLLLTSLHYRADDLTAAEAELDIIQQGGSITPDDGFRMALLAARRGQGEEARGILRSLQNFLAGNSDRLPWQQELIYHLLAAEVERTLAAPPAPATARDRSPEGNRALKALRDLIPAARDRLPWLREALQSLLARSPERTNGVAPARDRPTTTPRPDQAEAPESTRPRAEAPKR